ncbi:hypothetical protein EVAR_41917_1 [Eumeta japonica]|uniref:Uncharacterized protein n=1 Tax=Eumeta variegata TaxID=151549 RepID=A0A4C1XM13_EUMVA|nr:hypothetical protein EVAR_41917_1 [Eumeta japonica]
MTSFITFTEDLEDGRRIFRPPRHSVRTRGSANSLEFSLGQPSVKSVSTRVVQFAESYCCAKSKRFRNTPYKRFPVRKVANVPTDKKSARWRDLLIGRRITNTSSLDLVSSTASFVSVWVQMNNASHGGIKRQAAGEADYLHIRTCRWSGSSAPRPPPQIFSLYYELKEEIGIRNGSWNTKARRVFRSNTGIL